MKCRRCKARAAVYCEPCMQEIEGQLREANRRLRSLLTLTCRRAADALDRAAAQDLHREAAAEHAERLRAAIAKAEATP